ncbi:hypothetical protein HUE58_06320 [Candidatus Ruthia endofausta]|uniref:Uncharacterized protein n=1 Tax=Candidatus Ruthia endofausta TaxID=2738852 RepID=A0A6N0HMP8_9GAMM|nr:hypothetical protein [Candidatus Ruthia endofausta]QKQ23625.1 hypothetical protein HUE58_06320 [Candidatus Ruthia endofausta]
MGLENTEALALTRYTKGKFSVDTFLKADGLLVHPPNAINPLGSSNASSTSAKAVSTDDKTKFLGISITDYCVTDY